MIATDLIRPKEVSRRALPLLVVALASFVLVAGAALLQQAALGLALFAAVLVLSACRPRFGLYTAIFLLMVFELQPRDPVMYVGWLIQSDISSWTPLRFVNFTPIELVLLTTAAAVAAGYVVERRSLPPAQFRCWLLVLVTLTVGGVGYGLLSGGSLNIALWETRWLVGGVLIAFLAMALLQRRSDVDRLLNLILLALVLLSIDIIWRRFVLLAGVPDTGLDLEFAHDTPTLLNFAVILLLARLIWPSAGPQRALVLFAPLILYAEMLTNRRAGWVGLDLGLVLLAVFVFKLRRRLFWFGLVPLMVLYGGYLLVAWNAQGAWAEPARAVRSIDNPDARDAASNAYRGLELSDVRLNILAHPLTGLGFGTPYTFYTPLPDLSWWPFWHYEAHNSVLWFWMNVGPFGFMALLGLLGAAIVRGVQLAKTAPVSQAAPVVALVSALLMIVVYCYVDLGLESPRIDALFGLAVGVLGVWAQTSTLLQASA